MKLVFLFFFFCMAAISQSVQPVNNLYTISATLVDKTTGKPASGRPAFVSVTGTVFEFRAATSDSSGRLTFLIKNLESSKQLIFQTDNTVDSNLQLQFDEPLAKRYDAERYGERIKEVGDTLPFFGQADKNYVLDDYVRFPTMEEVFREFIAEVKIRKVRDRFRLEVLNVPYKLFMDRAPLMLLDGVPVFDMNALMAVDPLKIRNIHVVARRYYFGTMVFSGIISLSSYAGDLAGYQLPRHAQVRDVSLPNP